MSQENKTCDNKKHIEENDSNVSPIVNPIVNPIVSPIVNSHLTECDSQRGSQPLLTLQRVVDYKFETQPKDDLSDITEEDLRPPQLTRQVAEYIKFDKNGKTIE